MIKAGEYYVVLEDGATCANVKRGDIVIAKNPEKLFFKKLNGDGWFIEEKYVKELKSVKAHEAIPVGTRVITVESVALGTIEENSIGVVTANNSEWTDCNSVRFDCRKGREFTPNYHKLRVIPDLTEVLDINTITTNTNNENKGSDVDMMTIGTRVMAVVDSRVGVYEAGDIGTVTKFREDIDGATVGVLFDHKDVVTFVKPQNFTTKFDDYTDDEVMVINATGCGCGHCTCGDNTDDGDQVYIIADGNGYAEGDCGVKIADVRGGILVDFADDDGKPVYVLDGDFMYGLPAPIVTPYGAIKFYNLSSLNTKGWKFDDAGVLRHPDYRQFMAGAMLNLIDGTFEAVTREDEGDDNIVITVDGEEFVIAKALKGILFKDVK